MFFLANCEDDSHSLEGRTNKTATGDNDASEPKVGAPPRKRYPPASRVILPGSRRVASRLKRSNGIRRHKTRRKSRKEAQLTAANAASCGGNRKMTIEGGRGSRNGQSAPFSGWRVGVWSGAGVAGTVAGSSQPGAVHSDLEVGVMSTCNGFLPLPVGPKGSGPHGFNQSQGSILDTKEGTHKQEKESS